MADITCIPTWAGFLYLAVVVDVWSRRVVGWAMATHLRSELVLNALDMAIGQRRPTRVIHHSDQGGQYTSIAFGLRCHEVEVVPSMGRVGDGLPELRDMPALTSGQLRHVSKRLDLIRHARSLPRHGGLV